MSQESVAISTSHVALYALDPAGVQSEHLRLADWFRAKLAEVETELKDAEALANVAAKTKWNVSAGARAVNASAKRADFYRKCIAAIEAGYLIVPNMPCETLAIRTARRQPGKAIREYRSSVTEKAPGLPAGAGEYRSPEPTVETWDVETQNSRGEKVTKWQYQADQWRDPVMPVEFVKAEIIREADRAMALKVFDEIGMVRDGARDPILLGRILNGTKRPASFFIGWAVNTRGW